MAKEILHLPLTSADSFCLSVIGWDSIEYYIDKMKLMYMWRLLNRPNDNIYRNVFVNRFIKLMYSGIFLCESPTAQIINVCSKYKILDKVINFVILSELPCKPAWKRIVKNVVNDRQFFLWRRNLKMYINLTVFRNISCKYEMLIWVKMIKSERHLAQPCYTILKLLCGISCLAVFKCHGNESKICQMCQTGVKECVFHFVMECDKFNNERQSMLHKIESSVTDQAKNVLINLP